MLRLPQLTGDDEAVQLEHPPVLWRVLELIEKAAVAAGLEHQPHFGSLFDEVKGHEQARVTILIVVLAAGEVGVLLDPNRRRSGWLKLPGGRAAGEPDDLTEVEAIGGERAEGVQGDSIEIERMLGAIRQSLTLVALLISATDDSGGIGPELVERRTRPFEEEHLARIRVAAKLIEDSCGAVLAALVRSEENR